jgi:uncharacterized membrane protein
VLQSPLQRTTDAAQQARRTKCVGVRSLPRPPSLKTVKTHVTSHMALCSATQPRSSRVNQASKGVPLQQTTSQISSRKVSMAETFRLNEHARNLCEIQTAVRPSYSRYLKTVSSSQLIMVAPPTQAYWPSNSRIRL